MEKVTIEAKEDFKDLQGNVLVEKGKAVEAEVMGKVICIQTDKGLVFSPIDDSIKNSFNIKEFSMELTAPRQINIDIPRSFMNIH